MYSYLTQNKLYPMVKSLKYKINLKSKPPELALFILPMYWSWSVRAIILSFSFYWYILFYIKFQHGECSATHAHD